MTDTPEVSIDLPYWFTEFYEGDWRHAYLWGPRMGYKTHSIMVKMVLLALTPVENSYDGKHIFFGREYEADLDDSLWNSFKSTLERLQVSHLFQCTDSDKRASCLTTGRKIVCGGLFGRSKKSGIRGLDEFAFIWIDEAQEVSQRSILNLENTIFRYKWAHAVYSFNRDDYSAIWQHMEKKKDDPRAFIQKCHWKDAPFLDEDALTYIAEYERDYPDLFQHDFEAEQLIVRDAQVFRFNEHWEYADLDDEVKARDLLPYHGLDPGWTQSPSVLVRAYYFPHKQCLYVSDVHHATNMKATDFPGFVAGDDFVNPSSPRWLNNPGYPGLIPADEIGFHELMVDTDIASIRELKDAGFNIWQAKSIVKKRRKNLNSMSPDSTIARGIYWLQHLKGGIRLHPTRCAFMGREFNLYSYQERPGEPGVYMNNKYVKKNDHSIDALRYCASRLINEVGRSAGSGFVHSF